VVDITYSSPVFRFCWRIWGPEPGYETNQAGYYLNYAAETLTNKTLLNTFGKMTGHQVTAPRDMLKIIRLLIYFDTNNFSLNMNLQRRKSAVLTFSIKQMMYLKKYAPSLII
jgi:hypothetical protein